MRKSIHKSNESRPIYLVDEIIKRSSTIAGMYSIDIVLRTESSVQHFNSELNIKFIGYNSSLNNNLSVLNTQVSINISIILIIFLPTNFSDEKKQIFWLCLIFQIDGKCDIHF